MNTWIPWAIGMDKWCQNELKWDVNPMSNMNGQMMPKWTQMMTLMSNMDGQMMPKWTQMTTWIPWAIWMDKWCQNKLKWWLEYHEQYGWTNDAKMNSNELKWRLESHEQYGWTNDAKMNSNDDLNIMSNMDGQMMPKWTQMKTWISWAIWMDKWCQNELKWRLESHEQYGWTNDALNSNELKWRLEAHEQYGWTNDAKMNSNEDLNPMSNMDGQMMPKWTQMKTWIPWAIWMDKWCQNELKWNELKWRLESHEQYGWTNDAKILNSNEDLNPMSNIDGQMMPKWTQMNSNEDLNLMSNMDGQMMPNENELKWRLESHEQYGWTNDAKMNSNGDLNKWCSWWLEYHEQYGWTNDAKMNSNEDLNIMSNMDGQMMPKWTQMKTWIPWAIWMDKWCQNGTQMNSNEDLNLMSNMDGQMMPKWTQMKTWTNDHEQYGWTNDAKMNSNELKWRLESHEQYGWTNDAKMNSNEDLNSMSNMDGQMIPKWTQMKTWISWAIWMDKWCQNELKWRLESHEQYGCTNDAKMNSNEDLNPMSNMDGQMMPKWTQMNSNEDLNLMSNMDGQMMPKWTQMKTRIPCAILMHKWCQNELKWTQMKTWIPWAIWMDKWLQNELKWRIEYHEQYGWRNDAKMNSNEDKWRLEFHGQYGWTNDAKINSNEHLNPMSNRDGQMMPKWTQIKTWIPWAIWMDKWCQNELKWRLESREQYGWTNDAKMNSNGDLNPMSNMNGQMMPK